MNPGTPKNPTTPTSPVAPAVPDAEETGAEETAANAAEETAADEHAAEETAAKDATYSLDKGVAEAEVDLAVADDAREGSASGSDQDADQDPDPDSDVTDSDIEESDSSDFDKGPSGLGSAAAAVVAAGLGVVALTGSWTGKIAAERETLIGQIKTSTGGGTAAQQISEIYGDAWHTTALVNGIFSLLALLVGIFALVRPAFGAPSPHPQPGWVRAVATAGIVLGVLGLLISVGVYSDLIMPLPTLGATQ
ncbi:hypothetical protein ABT115_19470 [Streptomyces sp. NPDC001832]|uniref:hypothetical protein n=1 Tax=Streptomyces sp. NPDC001832 TaxID=3154527 RepID=UPI00331B9CB3